MNKGILTTLVIASAAAIAGVGYAVTNNYNQAKIKDLNTQVEQKETANADQRQEISGLNKSINSLTVEKDNLIAENNDKSESIKNLQADIENKQTQIENLQKDMTAKSNEIETLNSQISSNNTQISNLQADIDDKKAEIARLEAEGEDNTATINSLNADIQNKQTQISNLTADVATKTSELNDLQTRFDELEEKCGSYYDELDKSQARVTELENEIATNNTTINDLNTQLTQKQSELAALQLSINEKDETISKLENFSPKKQLTLSDGNICYFDNDLVIFDISTNKYYSVDGIKNFNVDSFYYLSSQKYIFVSNSCPSALVVTYLSSVKTYMVTDRLYVGNGQKTFIDTSFGVGIKSIDNEIVWYSKTSIIEKLNDCNYVSLVCGTSSNYSYFYDVKNGTSSALDFSILDICNLQDGVHTLVSTKKSGNVYEFYLYDSVNGFVLLETNYNCILSRKISSLNEKHLILMKSGCVVYAAPGKIMMFNPSDNSFSILYENTAMPTYTYGYFCSTENYIYLNQKIDGKQILINQNTNEVSYIEYKNNSNFMIELTNGNLVGFSSSSLYLYDFNSSSWNLISSFSKNIFNIVYLGNNKILVTLGANSDFSSTYIVDVSSKTKECVIEDTNFWGLTIKVNDSITIIYSGYFYYQNALNGIKASSYSCVTSGLKIYNSSTNEFKSYFESDGVNSINKNSDSNICLNINGLNYSFDGTTFSLVL